MNTKPTTSGIELNPTTNWYDLFYRNYDPVLGRMNQVDPMASKYASLTPYNYAFNSPAVFNDPRGDQPPGDCMVCDPPQLFPRPKDGSAYTPWQQEVQRSFSRMHSSWNQSLMMNQFRGSYGYYRAYAFHQRMSLMAKARAETHAHEEATKQKKIEDFREQYILTDPETGVKYALTVETINGELVATLGMAISNPEGGWELIGDLLVLNTEEQQLTQDKLSMSQVAESIGSGGVRKFIEFIQNPLYGPEFFISNIESTVTANSSKKAIPGPVRFGMKAASWGHTNFPNDQLRHIIASFLII